MILVVDDEPSIVEAIGSVLEDEGYPVATAGNGVAALRALEDGLQPCLAILDLMMPAMNGYELRAAMEDDPRWQDIPVVILSAFVPSTLSGMEMSEVIPKPFDLEEILAVAERYCGEPARTS